MADQILIPTFTGELLDLLHPNPALIHLEDIAQSLSKIPRYLGHTIRPLSVAEHSVRVAWVVTKVSTSSSDQWLGREALMHDAHEAYTGDIVKMLKVRLGAGAFLEIEAAVDRAVRQRFGLLREEPELVKYWDTGIRQAEIYSGLFMRPEGLFHTGVYNGSVDDRFKAEYAMRDFDLRRFMGSGHPNPWGWDHAKAYIMFMEAAERYGVKER